MRNRIKLRARIAYLWLPFLANDLALSMRSPLQGGSFNRNRFDSINIDLAINCLGSEIHMRVRGNVPTSAFLYFSSTYLSVDFIKR